MIEKMGGGIGGGGRVEVIAGKGCSRLFMDFSSSFRDNQSFSLEPFSPASSASTVSESPIKIVKSNGPFSGLIICVTGLSKGILLFLILRLPCVLFVHMNLLCNWWFYILIGFYINIL